jgi:hypothetical protein
MEVVSGISRLVNEEAIESLDLLVLKLTISFWFSSTHDLQSYAVLLCSVTFRAVNVLIPAWKHSSE